MKKNISNEEITKEVKKWIASFTKDEWHKKLEEEKYLYELNKVQNLEWLIEGDVIIINDLPNIEFVALTSKDERRFAWTLSAIPNKDIISLIPISYVEVFLEAA